MKLKDMMNIAKNSFNDIYDKINAPFVNNYAYSKAKEVTNNNYYNKLIF